MSEEGGGPTVGGVQASGHGMADIGHHKEKPTIETDSPDLNKITSPMSPRLVTPNPWSRKNTSLDMADYFEGPRDMKKHSKWPIFLRMHGSILPEMIVPLFFVGGWATAITCIHQLVKGANLSVSSVLLTITGFVVSLGLSFRSSTAYERYAEGRRFWAQLILATNNLGRTIWIHARERPGMAKEDVLGKLTGMNLLVAFAVSLKHKLRYEPYTDYDDLSGLVGHLDTFAKAATEADDSETRRPKAGFFKATGQYLGVSFAASNPRKMVKRANKPLGNLPLEILTYLSAYLDNLVENGQLPVPMTQTVMYNNISLLNDILAGCERVATTPLPIAYAISIHQITWVYVILLPFQLLSTLDWITIPATIAASYIILGLLMIGNEIEDPFGQDVNDLPLDEFCAQIATELDVIASIKKPTPENWIQHPNNKPLYPLSQSGYAVWAHRSEERVREAVKAKTQLGFEDRKREQTEDSAVGENQV